MNRNLFTGKTTVKARALYIGERIDLRTFETTNPLAVSPLLIRAGENGAAALFRYGAVVLFNLTPMEEISVLGYIKNLVQESFSKPEIEEVELTTVREGTEHISGGKILLQGFSNQRLQIVADVLAKSVVMARYEADLSEEFDRIEPLARELKQKGRGWSKGKNLTRQIGGMLLIHHKMVGRAEVNEKPDLLWENPELERLYARLSDEYELKDRHAALERKLELIFRTVETVLDLLETERALVLERAVVALIVLEILISVYELFFHR